MGALSSSFWPRFALCSHHTHGRCSPGHLSPYSLAHVSFLTFPPAFKQSPPAIPALGTNVKKRRHGDEDTFYIHVSGHMMFYMHVSGLMILYMHVSGLGGQSCVFPSPKIQGCGSPDVTRDGQG